MCKALLADKGRSQIANIQSCCDNAKTWMTSYYYTPSRQIRNYLQSSQPKVLVIMAFENTRRATLTIMTTMMKEPKPTVMSTLDCRDMMGARRKQAQR
jgi:hypothetical protein